MVTTRQLLEELARRIEAARQRGDFQTAETYTVTAMRVANETEADRAVSGQRTRAARARDHAANLARLPMGERVS